MTRTEERRLVAALKKRKRMYARQAQEAFDAGRTSSVNVFNGRRDGLFEAICIVEELAEKGRRR